MQERLGVTQIKQPDQLLSFLRTSSGERLLMGLLANTWGRTEIPADFLQIS